MMMVLIFILPVAEHVAWNRRRSRDCLRDEVGVENLALDIQACPGDHGCKAQRHGTRPVYDPLRSM